MRKKGVGRGVGKWRELRDGMERRNRGNMMAI